jgi:hypothetical protein
MDDNPYEAPRASPPKPPESIWTKPRHVPRWIKSVTIRFLLIILLLVGGFLFIALLLLSPASGIR